MMLRYVNMCLSPDPNKPVNEKRKHQFLEYRFWIKGKIMKVRKVRKTPSGYFLAKSRLKECIVHWSKLGPHLPRSPVCDPPRPHAPNVLPATSCALMNYLFTFFGCELFFFFGNFDRSKGIAFCGAAGRSSKPETGLA